MSIVDIDNFDDLDNLDNLEEFDDDDLYDLFDRIDYKKDCDEIKQLEENDNECPECKTSDHIIEDHQKGIIVCSNCGCVLSNIIDSNPEWKQYDDDGKAEGSRCSYVTNPFLPQSSLGTTIGGTGKSRIKTLHGWSAMPYKERSLHFVLKEYPFQLYSCR